jgi:hypothetical protein
VRYNKTNGAAFVQKKYNYSGLFFFRRALYIYRSKEVEQASVKVVLFLFLNNSATYLVLAIIEQISALMGKVLVQSHHSMWASGEALLFCGWLLIHQSPCHPLYIVNIVSLLICCV